MQAITLDLSKSICGKEQNIIGAEIEFSMKPFIDFLREKFSSEKTAKINFYKYMLDQFLVYPELMSPIQQQDTAKYGHLYELIYTALSPIINDEHDQLWALSKPVSPCFYYGTNEFYDVLMDQHHQLRTDLSLPSQEEMEKKQLNSFYNLIMKKFYNFSLSGQDYTIKAIVDHKTHLLKYFRLDIDNRFITIDVNGELPELTLQGIKEYMNDENSSVELLSSLLPPDMFRIEGISIVTLTDVTAEYALESIKNTIIDHNQSMPGWSNDAISKSLKSLVGTDAIEFGLLPYIRLNKKTLLYSHEGFESIIIKQAKLNGVPENEYADLADNFVARPRRLIFPEITSADAHAFPMLKLIRDSNVKSYALFPLYYNGRMVGCLELYTYDATAFRGDTLAKIDAAFPLLAQLYQNIIVDFNNEIMTIVTDKFTALQSSVQWRFYQVAYNYMKSGGLEKNLQIEPVYFKDVHPFYGAIDIRNSSIERNLMIRKDLFAHFEVLQITLENLRSRMASNIADEIPQQNQSWDPDTFDNMSDREIMKTDDYLQRQLPPYLATLKEGHPEVSSIVDEYFKLTQPGGKIFENRDNYELSMQMINHAVNRHLDEFNTELQEIYPSYFEKFRTDGVEFDMYLGQSITPDIAFDDDLVRDFRFRQLKAVAEIAQITGLLTPHLPIPLETTQLIFVYGKLIDISFRLDEQRFDVEGSYNIRYQMVKKRIDKAHVRDSTERLTQPGKIAIVYFNTAEAVEYLAYIHRLQALELLSETVEYLDVEELQGVEGLKALRVRVTNKV